MFRLHLHPSPFGLLFGIAVIAFWALLWLWFFAQLPEPGRAAASADPALEVASAVHPGASHAARAVASARGD